MPKRINNFKVLNDFNDIYEYLLEQKQKQQKERLIIISILGVAIGLTLVILFAVWKGY